MKAVNHPPHYNGHPSGVECIEIVENLTFCLGNAIKYAWRMGRKGQDCGLEDLKKALWYARRAGAISDRFGGWSLPPDVNRDVGKKIQAVLALEPPGSAIAVLLRYTIEDELSMERDVVPFLEKYVASLEGESP